MSITVFTRDIVFSPISAEANSAARSQSTSAKGTSAKGTSEAPDVVEYRIRSYTVHHYFLFIGRDHEKEPCLRKEKPCKPRKAKRSYFPRKKEKNTRLVAREDPDEVVANAENCLQT